MWLALLPPASLILVGHARLVSRFPLRSWSGAAGNVGVLVALAAIGGLAIAPALEPGKLDDPGGCTALEEADRPFGPGRAEKPAEGFEDRQIWLRSAVVLEACAGR